jgi:hypothetical protein
MRARPEARLDFLPYEQHEQLCRWLLTQNVSYREIRQKIKKSFGFDISGSAIAQFYKNHVIQHLAAIRARAVNVAAGYVTESTKSPAEFTAATVDALEAKAMQAALDPATTPKDLKVYLDLVCRWQELRLRGQEVAIQLRKLRMLERKQRKLEAVLSGESNLTSDEVARRCRIIFKQNGETEPKPETVQEQFLETPRELSIIPPRPAPSVPVPVAER